MKRLDDLCRSERFFTSTLLGGLLLDDDLNGLIIFLQWLSNHKQVMMNTVDGSGKTPFFLPKDKPDHIEVITEFNIKRELKYFNNGFPLNLEEKDEQNVPDVVIVYGNFLFVIEAKFFVKGQTPEIIDNQLLKQKGEINIMVNYLKPQIQFWHHLYLGPNNISLNNCDSQLTWKDIEAFSLDLLGSGSYIFNRLKNANSIYLLRNKLKEDKYYKGKCSFEEIKKLSQEKGNEIIVGFDGGISNLITSDYGYIVKRKYKWDDFNLLGGKTSANWINGNLFYKTITDLLRQHSKAQINLVKIINPKNKNYSDLADYNEVKELCKIYGMNILIGFTGGKKKLREASLKMLQRRKFKYDLKNNLQGKKISKNWINGISFLNIIQSK